MTESERVDELLREAGPRALRIAARLVGAGDAEDAVQEALLRTCDARGVRDPQAWFIRVLINHCLGVQRRHRLWRLFQFAHDPAEPIAAADAALQAARDAAAVRARVRALPPMQQTVVQLRFGEDLSIAEIAAAVDVGEETVKTHLQRALERLRRETRRDA